MDRTIQLDPGDPAFKANPYPTYARLQAESPIHRAVLPDGRAVWLVTRYADALAVLRDPRFVRDWRKVLSPEQLALRAPDSGSFRFVSRHFLDMDPPDHTRLRALVQKAFTASFVAGMRERIQDLADRLITSAAGRGEMDLMEDYASPFGALVMAAVLDLPACDRERIQTWSDAMPPRFADCPSCASPWPPRRSLSVPTSSSAASRRCR